MKCENSNKKRKIEVNKKNNNIISSSLLSPRTSQIDFMFKFICGSFIPNPKSEYFQSPSVIKPRMKWKMSPKNKIFGNRKVEERQN